MRGSKTGKIRVFMPFWGKKLEGVWASKERRAIHREIRKRADVS